MCDADGTGVEKRMELASRLGEGAVSWCRGRLWFRSAIYVCLQISFKLRNPQPIAAELCASKWLGDASNTRLIALNTFSMYI